MISNINEEAQKVLDKLTSEEKQIIWGLVSSPPSQRARTSARRELTTFLVAKLDCYSYIARIVMYRDLFDLLLLETEIPNTNRLRDVLGEVCWLNCHEEDRPLAVMMAIKKLNATLSFKKVKNDSDLEIELEDYPVTVATITDDNIENNCDDLPESDLDEDAYIDDLEEDDADVSPAEFFDSKVVDDMEEDHIPL